MRYTTLHNGLKLPTPGLGTYKIGNTDKEVYNAMRSALDLGYRHIDTATLYHNEAPIGKAIRDSKIARETLFVTTKIWGSDILSNRINEAFDTSLQLLDIGYIDLYLVHWPVKNKLEYTWQAMESIYSTGKTKAIGVSNHLQHHLEVILKIAKIKPVVNQIEMHPYLVLDDLLDFCKANDIVCESWSPLGSRKIPLLKESILNDIGKQYNKSAAQVVLRWNLQRGVVPLPKSANSDRQSENLNIFDFDLTAEEMKAISSLNKNYRTGAHPDEIEF